MTMKINEKNLCAFASSATPVDRDGWLDMRGEIGRNYQKRWFVLKGNLLFYFDKKGDKEPVGVIILEGCTIELTEEESYSFKIVFHCEGGRTYFLCTNAQASMEAWMKALACASYDYMKLMVSDLQRQLDEAQAEAAAEAALVTVTPPDDEPKVPPRGQRPSGHIACVSAAMGLVKVCAGLLLLAYCCQAARDGASILAVFSSLSFSDHLVFRGYVSLLAQSGHSIVVMTPYPGHFQYPDTERIVELDVGEVSAPFWEEFRKLMTNTDDVYTRLREINEFSVRLAIAQLRSKQMTALLINPNIKFDLVITEADVPVLYAIAEKYQAPHIAITTSSGKIHQHEAKGNPIHPILYPDVNTLNYRNLTRWQKIVEFYRHIQTKNEYYNNYLPLCQLAAKKIIGLKRDLQEIEYDIDLLFIASNPALAGNRPVVPATIFVDRMHINPGLSLPPELKQILDRATNGVVYFSLGSLQDSEKLSPYILKTLTDAFRELPFTVLWKIGNATAINKPDNVIVHNWFPQQPLLAHPNVKAFITHGGERSLEEAVFYEVPIIGFPIVKSRKVFIGEITKYGAGEIVDTYYLEKESLKNTINEVVTNPKYKKGIAKLKDMVFDPLISGPDDAVWWTEYLLRHKTARHFRSPAVGLSFFQYYMLDLLFYLIAGILISLYLTYVILRLIVKRLRLRFSGHVEPSAQGKFKEL